jgi:chromosomal replication initiation ATPase DnaA
MLLLKLTSEVTGVSEGEILSRKRERHISDARFIAMYVMRKQGMSITSIGKAVNRHHTTVLHGLSIIEGHMQSNLFCQSRDVQTKVTRIETLSEEIQRQSMDKLITNTVNA